MYVCILYAYRHAEPVSPKAGIRTRHADWFLFHERRPKNNVICGLPVLPVLPGGKDSVVPQQITIHGVVGIWQMLILRMSENDNLIKF